MNLFSRFVAFLRDLKWVIEPRYGLFYVDEDEAISTYYIRYRTDGTLERIPDVDKFEFVKLYQW